MKRGMAVTRVTVLLMCLTLLLSSCGVGDSAYDIAVKNGFVGSEAEWLESLKGEAGAAGANGTDGADGENGAAGKDFQLPEKKVEDGVLYTLKSYSLNGKTVTRWEPDTSVDLSTYRPFTAENGGIAGMLGYYKLTPLSTGLTNYKQGGFIANGLVYMGNSSAKLQIKDFKTGAVLTTMTLDKTAELTGTCPKPQPHNNALSFVMPDGAKYPLIYTNCYSGDTEHKGTLCVYSVSDNALNITYTLGNSLNATTGKPSYQANKDGEYGHVTTVHDVAYKKGLYLTLGADFKYMIMCYDASGAYLGTSKGEKTAVWIDSDGTATSLDALKTTYSNISKFSVIYRAKTGDATNNIVAVAPDAAGFKITAGGAHTFSNKLEQLIKVGFVNTTMWTSQDPTKDTRLYGNFVIDRENGFLYALALKTGDNCLRTFKFKLPETAEGTYNATYGCNVLTLGEADILEYYDTPYAYSIQDVDFYNGYIFITEGFTNDQKEPARMRVIDVKMKKQVAVFELHSDFTRIEPEFICWYQGVLYYGNVKGDMFRIDFI